jgi:hypothetical protein
MQQTARLNGLRKMAMQELANKSKAGEFRPLESSLLRKKR